MKKVDKNDHHRLDAVEQCMQNESSLRDHRFPAGLSPTQSVAVAWERTGNHKPIVLGRAHLILMCQPAIWALDEFASIPPILAKCGEQP